MKRVIILLVVVLGLVGCGGGSSTPEISKEQALQEGLDAQQVILSREIGELEVVSVRVSDAELKDGSFFLLFGEIETKTSAVFQITLKTNGARQRYLIFDLPVEAVDAIPTDDNRSSISFDFELKHMLGKEQVCGGNYCYTPLVTDDLYKYFSDGNVRGVVLRLSRSDVEALTQ